MKKACHIIVSIVFVLLISSSAAQAQMMTVDLMNFLENLLQFIEQMMNTAEQYTQTAQQYEQLYYQIKSMQQLDPRYSGDIVERVQQERATLADLYNTLQSVKLDFEGAQTAWQKSYKSRGDLSKMKTAELNKNIHEAYDKTQAAIQDAVKAQTLSDRVKDDLEKLVDLLGASSDAEGELAAVQAGNQINAMNVLNFTRYTQMLAAQERQRSAEYQQEYQRLVAAQAAINKNFPGKEKNTLKNEGSGPGIVPFR